MLDTLGMLSHKDSYPYGISTISTKKSHLFQQYIILDFGLRHWK